MTQIEQQLEVLPLDPKVVGASLEALKSGYLPVRSGADGESLIDWTTGAQQPATTQAVGEIARELINQALDDGEAVSRILNGTTLMLNRITLGSTCAEMPDDKTEFTSLEVANILELFVERNPNTVTLSNLLDEGLSVEEIEIVYEASEQLRLSHGQVRSLGKFNLDLSDSDDLYRIDRAIDEVLKENEINMNLRRKGFDILIAELSSGRLLSDIIDGAL